MSDISCATVDAPNGERPTKSWTRYDTIALGVITAVGAVLRTIGITRPDRLVFDEPFYARDACWYIRPGADVCRVVEEVNLEHPPLGKWLIALGEAAFGFDPVGWRAASLVAGVLSIALTYVLARKLLRSTIGAGFAAGLLTIDFLHFVHSRVAMLDVFHGLFVLAAFTCLAFDRDALLAGRSGIRARPWRLLAGVMGGAATATKWSGLFTLVALVAIEVAWEVWRRRPQRRVRALAGTLRDNAAGLAIAFVLVPAVIYLLSHAGRVHGEILALPWSDGSWFEAFFERHLAAFRFHRDHSVTNPYASPPWEWLLLKRAFPYHFEVTDDGLYQQLLGGGSPLVWWLSIPALVLTSAVWLKHSHPGRPEGLVLGGFYWNFLPWVAFAAAPFLVGSQRTSVFIFYVVPLLPFMYIAMADLAVRAFHFRWGKAVIGVFVAGALALFVFYWPFLTDRPLTRAQWRSRIWVFNDCGRPPAPITVYDVRTRNGTATTRTIQKGRQYLPPEGWCWIQFRQDPSRVDLQRFLTRSPNN